jgi:hypothetical protein
MEWISVKESLPNEEQIVLIAPKNARASHPRKTLIGYRDHGDLWIQLPNYWIIKETVTHWMPLPEPPKE